MRPRQGMREWKKAQNYPGAYESSSKRTLHGLSNGPSSPIITVRGYLDAVHYAEKLETLEADPVNIDKKS